MTRIFPRVLVVEDEEQIGYVYAQVFRTWKWEARRATTCRAALEMLASRDVYDLVMLDLLMGDCDGIEILRWVKQNIPETKVLISTQKSIDQVADVAALKPDMLLIKPYEFGPVEAFALRTFNSFFEQREARLASVAAPAPASIPGALQFPRTIP